MRAFPLPGPASVWPSEEPNGCGTGHCEMELLCRVLAEGVSAPSARQYRMAEISDERRVKLHKVPRMASGAALEAD